MTSSFSKTWETLGALARRADPNSALSKIGESLGALARRADPKLTFLVFLLLSAGLFARHPATNFIFDEQEALLANPFLAARMPFWEAFRFDFWGLPPEHTIGSYRPLPSLLWRSLAFTLDYGTPYYFHVQNLLLHALVAFSVSRLAQRVTRSTVATWVSGLVFVTFGIAPEAVSGVVGIADELVTLFSVLALTLLLDERPKNGFLRYAELGLVVFFGFLSKETCVGALLVFCSLLSLPGAGSWRARLLRLSAALSGMLGFLVTKRVFYPVKAPLSLTSFSEVPGIGAALDWGLRLWAQPSPATDFMNNPLVLGESASRIATALDVFGRGLLLVLWPFWASGDYSYPSVTLHAFDGRSLFGLLALVVPALVGVYLLWTGRLRLLGLGLLWLVLTALPTANLFVLLPTIRADRLWYLPSVGVAWALGALAKIFWERSQRWTYFVVAFFVGVQALAARTHANDYASDLEFWTATVRTSPRSAKARLNLGVMVGARGRKAERLALTRSAVELAPKWPMGNVYLADTYCRMGNPDAGWPFYQTGFRLAPNQKSLLALGLQCLWDQKAYQRYAEPLHALGVEAPNSWLALLVTELELHGEENDGLSAEYRPRGYNQKPSQRSSQKRP